MWTRCRLLVVAMTSTVAHQVLNILEVCGEADASATEWQAMLLSGAGMVTGARALPRIRAQLMRYVVEAFWTIHFDAAHPMQRRMVVIPLAGSRNDPSGELTLLRIVQPRMGVVDDAAVDGKLASPCDARSAVVRSIAFEGFGHLLVWLFKPCLS